MKPLLVLDFASIVGGSLNGVDPSSAITGFALDNREVKPGDLFIAIKGERVDGHDFAAAAIAAGAVAVLAEQSVDSPHILVPNVVQALADYALSIRNTFNGPVIGITGSAGKTTTKELIAAALTPLGPVLKTEGNRNSEFTSPLLWAELEAYHKSVVVEMGMRGFGQVAHLASFTKPTIGVITNIGYSHIEIVGSREGIARAKAELLESLTNSPSPIENQEVVTKSANNGTRTDSSPLPRGEVAEERSGRGSNNQDLKSSENLFEIDSQESRNENSEGGQVPETDESDRTQVKRDSLNANQPKPLSSVREVESFPIYAVQSDSRMPTEESGELANREGGEKKNQTVSVLWAEGPYLDFLSKYSKVPVKTFGFSQSADCRIESYKAIDWRNSEIEGSVNGQRFNATIPGVGRHFALNAAAAILVATTVGVDPQKAAKALQKAQFPPMRMEIIEHNGVTIVLDAYNASPASAIAAIETLEELPAKGRRIAILGEMRELGAYAEDNHRQVGAALAHHGIDLAVLYGEKARWIGSAAQSNGMSPAALKYVDSIEEITIFLKSLKAGDVVLIKGSRALEMERALDYLKEPAL